MYAAKRYCYVRTAWFNSVWSQVKTSHPLNMKRIYCCCTFPGDDYAARFLIENGADVNIALSKSRLTPLHLCLMHPHDEWLPNPMAGIVELLLQKSADPNARSSDSRSVYKKLCYH